MLPRKWFFFAVFVLLSLPFTSLAAQDQPTVSIALPATMRNFIDESLFSDFESANNVRVYVNYVESGLPPISGGADAYLDAFAKYAASADVLYMSSNELNVAATRAGYLLDLSPLTSADSSLNSDDFIPAAWKSVQWDNGVWALPISVDATMLVYDPDAFDKAGLAYPNDHWTLDDLANAAKALTQYDASGSVAVPGLVTFGDTAGLLRSLYGKNFSDDSGNPKFDDPALEALLTQAQDLLKSGVVGTNFASGPNQAPMRIMGSFGLAFPASPNQKPPAATTLPGGNVGLSLNGFAVSSGTQQPELAYKLAEYLTSNAAIVNGPLGGMAARQSVAGTQPTASANSSSITSSSGGKNGGFVAIAINSASSPEAHAALMALLPQALSLPDEDYSDYVDSAFNAMMNQKIDAHTALQQAEVQATNDLQSAVARRSSVSVVVATPPPVVVLQPGKIALNFGIQSFVQPMPNFDQWQQLANDFSSSDPDVGEVNLDTRFGQASDFAQRDDCFYLSANSVPSLDESTIRTLDPYLEADSSFDPKDVAAGVLAQLQKDNHTWAYPLTLQPESLSYIADIFQKAGIPAPTNGWTVSQFADALTTLKTYLNKAGFSPHDLNNESLMMLIAAYGGLPLDYRTSPATINFTDPATVSAIQQVLDLAKNGDIEYQATTGSSGGGFRTISINAGDAEAIVSDSIGGFKVIQGGGKGDDPMHMTAYPTGTYNAASYTVGAGYISATAQNPDACYRWLSYIAQHIAIFGQMPARLSQINDPTMQAALGDNAAFYVQYAQLLQASNTIIFPSAVDGNNSPSDFVIQYWLNRAFDNYVKKDADLKGELASAQTYATAFQQCVSALPPDSQTGGDQPGLVLNDSIRDCAVKADPTVSDLFPSS